MSKICFFASLENLAGQYTGEGGRRGGKKAGRPLGFSELDQHLASRWPGGTSCVPINQQVFTEHQSEAGTGGEWVSGVFGCMTPALSPRWEWGPKCGDGEPPGPKPTPGKPDMFPSAPLSGVCVFPSAPLSGVCGRQGPHAPRVSPPQPALLHVQPRGGAAVPQPGHHLHPGLRHHPAQHRHVQPQHQARPQDDAGGLYQEPER